MTIIDVLALASEQVRADAGSTGITKNQKNPSAEDEPIGLGANVSEFPCESTLSQINSAASSPVGYTNSSSSEAKNQKYLSFEALKNTFLPLGKRGK